ncbi:MAG: YjjG family noncanonical pyrimidine nucleotidase [Tenericutes bacterium]|nr:YjjG family noncanonical pyrimidine nucleotidase [Mycoplasmatota bacterium]
MNYKMIIFDADDTLFDFSKTEEFAFHKAMKESEIPFKDEYLKIYKEINIAIWQEFEKGLITQKELKIDRVQRFFKAINVQRDAYSFSESFLTHLAQGSFLFDGVKELIQDLAKTHRLVLVTNGLKRVQNIRIVKSVIASYFEKIIISDEIGYAKPNPMIFIKGLEDIELPAKDKILMIGDGLGSDILGGINFGIDTLWYNPLELPNTKDINPTYEISSLKEIHNYK